MQLIAKMIRDWKAMSLVRKVRRVVMLGLFVFGLWALTPYLYNRQVNEEFPVTSASQPVLPAPALTSEPVTLIPSTAVATPVPVATAAEVSPTTPAFGGATAQVVALPTAQATAQPSGPVALSSGSFVAGSVPGDTAEGKATIYSLEDGGRVLRLENFSTTNGPDLFVTLHTGVNPEQDEGVYYELARLKGNQGNQNYELPVDLDLDKYHSVVIWCRAFNIVFGYATLQ